MGRLVLCAALFLAGNAGAEEPDVIFEVSGDLFEHGGLVEVWAIPADGDGPFEQQIVRLTDRYAKVEMPYDTRDGYTYRFRAAEDAPQAPNPDAFGTEPLSIGTRFITRDDEEIEADARSVRVLPMAEHGGKEEGVRAVAAWGTTQRYDDPPPANHWGARALMRMFEPRGTRRVPGLTCRQEGLLRICTPDPEDALLLEALWWRAVAEARLERLRHNALRACYDSGGLFGRPDRCDATPGRGWPEYEPAN
ncbi:MAG: hypothetical protein AAF231_13690 [Pseudomonadota bacterium]